VCAQDFGPAKSNNQVDSGRKSMSSARPSTAGGGTARTSMSQLSTNEVLRRMRESNDLEKNNRMTAEIHALGEYNSFSRPKSSSVNFVSFSIDHTFI
jgi:hypothetical protein